MKKTVIFFDLDDTLVVEEACAERSFIATSIYAQKKYGINPNELHVSVRTRARELWHKMPTYPYCSEILGISSWEALWAKFIGENKNLKKLNKLAGQYQTNSWYKGLLDFNIDDRTFAKELSRRFNIERRKRHILFPEVMEVLKKIASNYRLGLITNGTPDLQWEKIKGAGIESFFEHVVISGDVNVKKPNKEIFLRAIISFKTTKENCIMAGNSLGSDILGAKNAGIYSIWINRNKKELKGDIQPDKIITNLNELTEILEKHLKKN